MAMKSDKVVVKSIINLGIGVCQFAMGRNIRFYTIKIQNGRKEHVKTLES